MLVCNHDTIRFALTLPVDMYESVRVCDDPDAGGGEEAPADPHTERVHDDDVGDGSQPARQTDRPTALPRRKDRNQRRPPDRQRSSAIYPRFTRDFLPPSLWPDAENLWEEDEGDESRFC
jgi:hypothetical protein